MSSPFEVQGPAPQGQAASKVNAPAIALMVIAGINVAASLFGLVQNLMSLGAPQQALEGAPPVEGVDPQMMLRFVQGAGAVGIVFNIIAVAIAVVILLGALKMKKLESWGFAMAASILAMIPCLSPCCILGIPFGIWALVVLNNVEVKSAFH